tara:strand:- start:904 stop:1398 length:495 start_codon:yes stop_codon:yes gene_type:complete
MTVAAATEFSVSADVIEIPDGFSIVRKSLVGSMGSWVVGVTTILGVLTLMVLLGLAVIQTMITERHVELTSLQTEISEIQSLIGGLELQDQNARTPIRVEHLAEGYYAAIKAESPTQIQVRSAHLALRNPEATQANTRLTPGGTGRVGQLLARTAPSATANNGR